MNLAFPYGPSPLGRTAATSDEAHLRDLVEQVLFTAPGERVMRPTFGCGAAQLVFAPNSIELAGATRMLIQSALQQWLGDLIVVRNVGVEAQDALLAITVEYGIVRTGEVRVDVFRGEAGGAP
jgi:phage baseplate assembly protein W